MCNSSSIVVLLIIFILAFTLLPLGSQAIRDTLSDIINFVQAAIRDGIQLVNSSEES